MIASLFVLLSHLRHLLRRRPLGKGRGPRSLRITGRSCEATARRPQLGFEVVARPAENTSRPHRSQWVHGDTPGVERALRTTDGEHVPIGSPDSREHKPPRNRAIPSSTNRRSPLAVSDLRIDVTSERSGARRVLNEWRRSSPGVSQGCGANPMLAIPLKGAGLRGQSDSATVGRDPELREPWTGVRRLGDYSSGPRVDEGGSTISPDRC